MSGVGHPPPRSAQPPTSRTARPRYHRLAIGSGLLATSHDSPTSPTPPHQNSETGRCGCARRSVLLAGAATFGVISVLAALSTSPEMLIGARALLGWPGAGWSWLAP